MIGLIEQLAREVVEWVWGWIKVLPIAFALCVIAYGIMHLVAVLPRLVPLPW